MLADYAQEIAIRVRDGTLDINDAARDLSQMKSDAA